MEQKRRDFLKLATGALALTGGGFAIWPLIASLNPADEVPRPRKVDFSDLKAGEEKHIKIDDLLYVIRHHSADELAMLAKVPADTLRDKLARNPNLPSNTTATLSNRIIPFAPEFSIMLRLCLRESCLLMHQEDELYCPCCSTWLDIIGRVVKGPLAENLPIPTYTQSGEMQLSLAIEQHPVRFSIAM
jgi:ubiquinol-cytochrome c reductase iron-sulfur subunit